MAESHPVPGEPTLRGVRILFVLSSLGLGGAERQAFLLARHLLQREHADVHLLSLSPYSGLAGSCEAVGLPYEFFELRHKYRSRLGQLNDLCRFIRLLRRQRAQVVLSYCMFQNVLCGLTWRAGGARVCVWNQRDEGRSRLEPWVERLAVRRTPCFISNSRHGAEFLTRCLRAPEPRVHVVPNGIDVPLVRPPETQWRERLGLPSGAFVACMVANLHAKKDHATLVAAWRRVVDRFDGLDQAPHLLLAGVLGDQYDALVRQVATLSLEGHVHFLGEVGNVGDLLRTVDLAVFSSHAEGIPNAVLEAMAHELAVVATDYPGIREAVGPEGRSLLARPCDSEGLADKILMAAADSPLRERLGQQGRRRVVKLFSVDRMGSDMASIIRSEWRRVSS